MLQRPLFFVALFVLMAGCENSSDAGDDVLNQEIAARDQAIAERDQRIADMDRVIGILAQDIDATISHSCALIGTYDKYIESLEAQDSDGGRFLLSMMGGAKVTEQLDNLLTGFRQRRSEAISAVNGIQAYPNALTGESCTASKEISSRNTNGILVFTLLSGQIQAAAMAR